MNKRIITIVACILCAFAIVGTTFAINASSGAKKGITNLSTHYGDSGLITSVAFDKTANTIGVTFKEAMNPHAFGMGLNCAKTWTKTWNEDCTELTISDIDLSATGNPTLIIYLMQTEADKKDISEPNIFTMFKPLDVTTTANLVKKGEYFDVTASLPETTTVNAVSFVLNYDPDKFEYCGNLGADPAQDSYIDGVTYLTSDVGDGNVKLTLMIPDYKAKDLVSLRFRAKENADIQNADNSITATADLVYKTSEGSKFVFTVSGSTEFTSSGNPGDTDEDGKVTLLDLSNVIDMFGVKSGDALWTKAKFYDFNKNKVIDIADIVTVAKLIF